MMETPSSEGRKTKYSISHSGKFRSKNKKRMAITEQIWIGLPADGSKSKVSSAVFLDQRPVDSY